MVLKSLFWQLINSIIKICLEVLVFDRKIRRILKGNWAKFYLRKYVNKATRLSGGKYKGWTLRLPDWRHSEQSEESLTHVAIIPRDSSAQVPQNDEVMCEADSSGIKCSCPQNDKRCIWQYWESADGTIPPLVQACLNSVEKFKGDRKRIILTYETVKDYIDLPPIIYEMKECGKMNLAHFADIVRTALLVKYGGVWIDSTVLLTQELPEYIDSDLFFFQNDVKVDLDGLCGTNYFISAKHNNKILKETLDAMLVYWKENRFLVNYFTHMHIITMVAKRNKEIWEKIPFFSFYPVQQLQNELLKPFNNRRWNELKQSTSIHKLTHKKSVLTKKKDFSIEGTFFEHIIKEFK